MTNLKILVVFSATLLAAATMVRGRAGEDEGQGRAGGAPDSTRQAGPYPGCAKIFDGRSFRGWEADPSTWSIVDGAMRGVGGSSRLAYTTADYGSFRLIFRARMAPVNRDHLGSCSGEIGRKTSRGPSRQAPLGPFAVQLLIDRRRLDSGPIRTGRGLETLRRCSGAGDAKVAASGGSRH